MKLILKVNSKFHSHSSPGRYIGDMTLVTIESLNPDRWFSLLVWLMQMVSKGQVLIVKAGDKVHLECEYFSESFSLFDNPIVWRKAQRSEESQINMMGNLMEPFASAKRFRATFESDPPKYMFGLIIIGAIKCFNWNVCVCYYSAKWHFWTKSIQYFRASTQVSVTNKHKEPPKHSLSSGDGSWKCTFHDERFLRPNRCSRKFFCNFPETLAL